MILKEISVIILVVLTYSSLVFSERQNLENYDLVFKMQPNEVLIKYITPSYKKAKLVFDKIESIYYVKFSDSQIIEETVGKNLDEIDYTKKYQYIKDYDAIKKYCEDISKKIKKIEIEEICSKGLKKKVLKLISKELFDDMIFKVNFEIYNNDIIKKYVFDSEFNLEGFIEITNKINIREEKYYDNLMILRKKIVTKKEKFIEEISFYENDILRKKILNEFRIDSTLRKQTIYEYLPTGGVGAKIVSEYDALSFKDIEFYYDADLKLYKKLKYEYEFDKKGNWIKAIKYDITREKKVFSAVLREIKY